MNHREVLKNVYLFKNISPADLEALAGISSVENFAPNDEIFNQGDKAMALYLVKHGSVKIAQKTKGGDKVTVANLGVGAHFGEMAFLDGAPRSASAQAAEKSEIVVIPYDKLAQLVKERATFAVTVYKEMANFLAGRLRVTTSDLSFSREKNLSHF
jgi:CRP/FNR family cyclic AMP-dependent transcriptional regulator